MSLAEQLSLFLFSPPPEPVAKTRQVQIGARVVAYEVRQGRAQRLSMTIDERGLRIAVPPRLTFFEVERFVRSHGEWVLTKLDEYAARKVQRHVRICDGAMLPLLGGDATVRVVDGANRVLWQNDELVIAARRDADLDALARRGLQRRALEHFANRIGHFAAVMERPAPPVALSSARGRWGSCSTRSGIRINWRLIHLPPHLGDYVVAHEMAHLVEMNHSARFWRVVGQLFPDWRAARDELKQRAAEIPLI